MPATLCSVSCPTSAASLAVLGQCAAFVASLPTRAYTAPSTVLFGATIGQHVRHSLDHFAAALLTGPGEAIDYDHRERGTPIESDPAAAAGLMAQLRDVLEGLTPAAAGRSVRVRVMLTSAGDETELGSTLERELAFASHHAVHHHAMMAAIANELRHPVPAGFGKAPSTLNHERSATR